MAFADQKSLGDRSAGIAGVVLVHAGLAALIVVGLSTEVTREIFSGPLPSSEYKSPPPPSEPPKPQPKTEAPSPPIYVPPVPSPLPPKPSFVETTNKLPPISDEVKLTALPTLEDVGVDAMPSIKPAIATPRNNPSNWVTDSDYRSRWIREEMYGTASFQLDVSTNGRVENCQITKSTGHAVLDAATCKLITKRARFKPATDANGAKVGGTYSSSIRWVVPD